LCLFAIAVTRLLWQAIDKRPAAAPASRWMGVTATVIQWALSLLLLALPLTTVAGAWLEGHPLTLVAGIDVPPIFSSSGQTGATIAWLHTWLGDAIMWVAGLHALAALYHHFILGDYVLLSMLPRWIPANPVKKDQMNDVARSGQVKAESRVIRVSDQLQGSEYEALDVSKLRVPADLAQSRAVRALAVVAALSARPWQLFRIL
jgi:hypothetical protein